MGGACRTYGEDKCNQFLAGGALDLRVHWTIMLHWMGGGHGEVSGGSFIHCYNTH